MNDKIAWLEELLALEPNSKLFFLLAQAYAQKDRPQDAAKALQQGLSFHPEHLGARLLLIQCLAKLEQNKAAQDQSQHLADILAGHPEFWNFWAKAANQDMAIMLRLLAKYLKGEAVPWSEILEQGIKAVVTADDSERSVSPSDPDIRKTACITQESPEAPKIAKAAKAAVATTPLDQDAAAPLKTFDAATSSLAKSACQLSETERNYYETRTYADLLAEQGEDEEALTLYEKLLRLSRDDEQHEELEGRITALKEKSLKLMAGVDFRQSVPMQNTDRQPVEQLSPEAETQQATRSSELAKTLTRLAERLEARGQT
jgi:tetratricopeptide (TPR) repeat protein